MTKTSRAQLAVALGAAACLPFMAVKAGPPNAPITEASIRKGLVLHLTFDQNESGGKVADSSGRGNHGKASGVRWTAEGRKGGAYEFTADGNRIEVLNHASLNPQQLTLAAWIKTSTADGQWRRIIDKSYPQGFALSIAADWQGNKWNGLASLEIGPGTHFSLTRTMVADGQWHQVVATFDGVEQLLFVDGKPQGWPVRWEGPRKVGTNSFNLVIGCDRSDVGPKDLGVSFRGLIDEPMLWNRALSLREVAFLFDSQTGAASLAAGVGAGKPTAKPPPGVPGADEKDARPLAP